MPAYTLYSVKVTDGHKERFCHGATDDLEEAKHAAIGRAAAATYAYVKEFGGGTVYFIDWVEATHRMVDYYPSVPIEECRAGRPDSANQAQ